MRSIAAVLMALVLAACASGGGTSPSASVAGGTSAASPTAESPSPSESEEEPSPSEAEESPSGSAGEDGEEIVAVAESDLGDILVDAEGMTLYGFTNDTDGESTCYDQCEQNWPPLLVEGEIEVGEGLDDSDFTTVERTDGTMQVKIGDWPLYYFANDEAPGDTNGQAVGGVWFVVDPEGELIR